MYIKLSEYTSWIAQQTGLDAATFMFDPSQPDDSDDAQGMGWDPTGQVDLLGLGAAASPNPPGMGFDPTGQVDLLGGSVPACRNSRGEPCTPTSAVGRRLMFGGAIKDCVCN